MNRETIAISATAVALTLAGFAFCSAAGQPDAASELVVDQDRSDRSATGFRIPEHFIQQARRAAARERRAGLQERRRPEGLDDLSNQAAIDRMIEQAVADFRDPDRDVVRRATYQLAYLSDRAFSAVVKGASSDHVQTAIQCSGLLEHFGERGVDPLIDVARNHSNPTIRSFAISNLGQTNQPAAVPALIELLKDESPQVRNAAASALPWFRDDRTIPALERAANDPGTGDAAERALKEIQNPTWAPSWPPELLALKQLCNDASTIKGESFGRKEIETIASHLDHENSTVAGAAMLALGTLDTRLTLPHILKHSSAHYAIVVLASIPEPEAIDAIIEFVESASDTHNGVWLQYLRDSGRWVVPLLIAALDDDKLWVPARDEVDEFGFAGWPERHHAHSTLWGLLYEFGLKGETINLYNHNGARLESAQLRVWWKEHGDAFLAGKDVPNPKLTNVIYFDP